MAPSLSRTERFDHTVPAGATGSALGIDAKHKAMEFKICGVLVLGNRVFLSQMGNYSIGTHGHESLGRDIAKRQRAICLANTPEFSAVYT